MDKSLPLQEIEVRSYRPGDDKAINEMFCEVFKQNRSLDHWYWKYRDNPLGAHKISLGFVGKTLAAHYGGYPVVFYRKITATEQPTEFLSYHLGDKMTRKAFRSAGFGKASVLAKTFNHFRDTFGRNVPFGYGFGTHHSLRFGLLFLGYMDVEEVTYRRIDIQNLSGISLSLLNRLFLRTEEIHKVNDEWTRFFYAVAPEYRYLVKKDAVYLQWRYIRRPDRKYLILAVRRRGKLAGWSVFFREGEAVIWGDALFLPGKKEYLFAILKALCRHPISRGAKYIEGWFPPRPLWWHEFMEEIGFRASRELSNLHLTGPTFSSPELQYLMKENFYYTMGDSDLF